MSPRFSFILSQLSCLWYPIHGFPPPWPNPYISPLPKAVHIDIFSQIHHLQVLLLWFLSQLLSTSPGLCCPISLFFHTPLPLLLLSWASLCPFAIQLSTARWHFAFRFQNMQFPVTGLKGLKLERRQICKQAAMRCKCLTQVSFKQHPCLRKQPFF